jgi:acyl carrier protein
MLVIRTPKKALKMIADLVQEVTGIDRDQVTLEKLFVDQLDIDSLSMIEIAVRAEKKYQIKIPDEDIAGLRTVQDAVNYACREFGPN